MVTLGLDANAESVMPSDLPAPDGGTDSGGLELHHVTTKPHVNLLTDCDNTEDQIMAEQNDHQQMVLRSVTKNHHTEKFKGKNAVEEMLIDSDDENNLVIDCDISSEENQTNQTTATHEKLDDRKHMLLRPKIQNGNIEANEDENSLSQVTDVFHEPDNYQSLNTVSKKKKKMKFHSRWYKPAKIRKGDYKKMRKPLKRLLQRTKLKQKIEAEQILRNQVTEKDESENVPEKNTCPICEYEFFDSHSFTLHIREHNTDKLSHVCKICSKQLSSASSLDRHMYVHSGERPFECNVCKLRFTTNGNMHRHTKIHEINDKSKNKNESKGNKRSLEDNPSDLSLLSSSSYQENSQASYKEATTPKKAMYNIFLNSNKDNTLKCPVCGKIFTSADFLKSHMNMHSNDPIKCSTCNTTSENYAVYEKHSCSGDNSTFSSNFPKIGFHDLSFIEFSSSKFSLVAKQMCEKQSRNSSSAFFSWECIKCAKAFPSNQALYQHELSHEINNTSCYTCKCDFLSPKNFRDHQLKHRLTEHCSNRSESDQGSVPCKEDFLALLELCNKQTCSEIEKKPCEKVRQFDNMQYFVHGVNSMEHKDEDSGNDFADIKSIISLTSKTPIMPDMRASPVTASPASPPPATTGAIPTSPVIEGSANPSVDHPLPIDEGSNAASIKGDDNTSKDSFSVENYDCKKCSETFETSVALKQHMRAHSNRSTPLHQCNFCPYQSVDKSTLKRHMRKHNGEHPFKCSICDYVFTTKANGHRHVKNKHKLSEQEAADAVVYNPNMLEAKDSEGILSESNNSETVCKYCKIDFKYNRVLRHHLRSLNNSCSRKPYSCSICKQGFSTKNNCIRHITNHHPESKNKAKELVIINEINNSSPQDPSLNGSEEASEGETTPAETQPFNLTLCSSNEESIHYVEQDIQEFPGSDAEMVVAQSLVSLSELIPPQEKPLDLTLCALDLSLKDNDYKNSCGSDPNVNDVQSQILNLCTSNVNAISLKDKRTTPNSKPSPIQQSPVNLEIVPKPLNLVKSAQVPIRLITNTSNKDIPQTNTENQPLSLVCLPQIMAPLPIKSSVPVVYSNPKIELVPTTPEVCSVSSVDSIQPEEAQKNSQKIKKFSCDICFKGFTLKSNRERHIKNHHPEHARPPRSRNYIPTLSSSSAQKQNSSTLSDRTRDALRVALIAKTNNNSSKQQECVKTKDSHKTSKKLPLTNFSGQFPQPSVISPDHSPKKSKPVKKCHGKSPLKDKTDTTDLASVSDVIDAVNCQNFKQYLLDAKGTSDSSGVDEPCIQEIECVAEKNMPFECNNDTCEKKSSYAKCTKSIHCTYCKRKFPWKSSLSRHFLTHTGLKPHKCPKCPLSFTTKSNKDRHLFRQHSGVEESATLSDKPYKCSLCPSSFFSTKGKLKKHFYLKHLSKGESRQKNGNSDKVSGPLSNKSQKGHSGEPEITSEPCFYAENCPVPLDCHLCKNTFKAQEDLLSHLKDVHPLEIGASNGNVSMQEDCEVSSVIKLEPTDTDEGISENPNVESITDCCDNILTFLCSLCPLQFKSAQDLEEHAKSHTLNSPSLKVVNKSASEKTKVASSVNGSTDSCPMPKNSHANLPKKTPNSLLCLFAAAQQARTRSGSVPTSTSRSSQPTIKNKKVSLSQSNGEKPTEDENSLILNLLGLKDSEFVNEMLDSAVRVRVKKEKTDA